MTMFLPSVKPVSLKPWRIGSLAPNRAGCHAAADPLPRKPMTGTIPPLVCGRATVGQAIAAVPNSRRSRRRMHQLHLKALRHLKYRFGEGPAKFSPPAPVTRIRNGLRIIGEPFVSRPTPVTTPAMRAAPSDTERGRRHAILRHRGADATG